jgi:putative ABC transport system permease protein
MFLKRSFRMPPTLFLVRQAPFAWVVRTPTHALLPAIQEQLRQATGLPVSDVHTMEEVAPISSGRQRLSMLLMTGFGGSALLLAAIGIYGFLAYSVEQRTQETGIRLALGAQASQVRNMVVRQGMSLALAGVVSGLGAAWGLSRLIESFLFGVKGRDPAVFTIVPAVLGATALLAVLAPSEPRKPLEPPVDCLRHE